LCAKAATAGRAMKGFKTLKLVDWKTQPEHNKKRLTTTEKAGRFLWNN
jgi:hypothetical protein